MEKSILMNRETFISSLAGSVPAAGISDSLLALWYDAKGDWEGSHRIVQDLSGPMASRIHAYLHRKEGDLSNARYWYDRAGIAVQHGELEQEWEKILAELLNQ